MKTHVTAGLHHGQTTLYLSQLAAHCRHLFANSLGDQLLVVALGASQEDLLARISALMRQQAERDALSQIGDCVLVPSRCSEALLNALHGKDEMYVVPGTWRGTATGMRSYLPELASFENGAPADFITTFIGLEALRYFSDGLGTNFCVKQMSEAHDIQTAEQTAGGRWV